MGLSQLTLAPCTSPSLCIQVFVFLCYFGLFITFVIGGGNETDRLALLQFKSKITHDPMGVMSSWNNSLHFCQWQGVTCGRRHQRVTILDLQSKNLGGSISAHIGNLSFLRILTLFNNSFTDTIPQEVGRLRRLQELSLYNNSISGKIPSNISSCTNLISIGLDNNQLFGEIPAQLALLSKLREFIIRNNHFTGTIPPLFGNLSVLEVFDVVYNSLVGSIPDSFGQLKKLEFFAVTVNRLSGPIPPSIFNISSLEEFDVGANQIGGSLPLDLGINLPNLQFFSIDTNQFTGSIPISISNASNLYQLSFAKNKLTGKVPSLEMLQRLEIFASSFNFLGNGWGDDLRFLCSLTNASNLRRIAIAVNNLGGVLPDCISHFSTTLTMLDLQQNKISGNIPPGIGNLINLEFLSAYDNTLSGHIPREIENLSKLQYLDLSENNFSGNIPPFMGNLKLLLQLYLEGNNLSGVIPSNLAECENLLVLSLFGNNLRGSLPPKVIGLSFSLNYIDLSANQFTGVLPMEIGNSKNLKRLNISQNKMFGKIPATLGDCIALEYLDMAGNSFEGPIPSSLEKLKGIELLDLSNNNLSGVVPKFLEGFKFLQLLNLSYNHFEGEVSTHGIFKNTSATSVKGNSELCGGMPEFQLPKCEYKKSKKRPKLTLALKSMISALSGLLGIALIVSFLRVYLRKKRKENASSNLGDFLLNVSYQSLLKATDGFSTANLIGQGSFGSVFKGIMHDHGALLVAVKVLNLSHHGASKSFIAECEALRNIRHRNLLKVLTACSGADYQDRDFKALVYEFMVNGNLDEWLHSTPRINEASPEHRSLSVIERMNIAIDVANALEYLHHDCETTIVHCDLKPSNVLLDEEMTARVGDFGLARLLLKQTRDFSTNQSSSIGVRGTMGYAAPEYGLGNEVSTYGDIYSYGVLLLEIFTGKKPTDNMFTDGFTLHDFAKAGLQERVIDILDPVLLSESENGETGRNHVPNQTSRKSPKIRECLSLLLGVGVACSVEIPGERLNMRDVVAKLHSIRRKLLGTNRNREALPSTSSQR